MLDAKLANSVVDTNLVRLWIRTQSRTSEVTSYPTVVWNMNMKIMISRVNTLAHQNRRHYL
jgi:hypothetical protein